MPYRNKRFENIAEKENATTQDFLPFPHFVSY